MIYYRKFSLAVLSVLSASLLVSLALAAALMTHVQGIYAASWAAKDAL